MAEPKGRIFADRDELRTRVAALGRRISDDYQGCTLDVVYLINGAGVFGPDLVRELSVPVRMHPLAFSGYGQGAGEGEVRILLDVAEALHARHVLLVEGIVVSGRTPGYLMDLLRLRGPATLELCALGVKSEMSAGLVDPRYVAFELGGEFLVGYGIGSAQEKADPCLRDVTP